MIAVLIASFLFGMQGTVTRTNDGLVDGDRVHMFLPPVFVSDGIVLWSAWSDDGRYLLVATEDYGFTPSDFASAYEGNGFPQGERKAAIHSYDSRTGKVSRLWSGTNVSKAELAFFAGTDIAVAHVTLSGTEVQVNVLRLTPAYSRIELIETTTGNDTHLIPDPEGKFVISTVAPTSGKPIEYRFLTPSGQAPARLVGNTVSNVWWGAGSVAYTRGKDSKLMQLTPTEIKPLATEPVESKAPIDTRRIHMYVIKTAVLGAAKLPVVVARMADSTAEIAVAYDADYVDASPKDNGLLYTSRNTNFVRPIVEVKKSMFTSVLGEIDRKECEAEVEAIGVAINRYAADYDGMFPTKHQYDYGALWGYVAERELLKKFVYYGRAAKVEPLEKTAVGHQTCMGGRYVLYQDGSVLFEPAD